MTKLLERHNISIRQILSFLNILLYTVICMFEDITCSFQKNIELDRKQTRNSPLSGFRNKSRFFLKPLSFSWCFFGSTYTHVIYSISYRPFDMTHNLWVIRVHLTWDVWDESLCVKPGLCCTLFLHTFFCYLSHWFWIKLFYHQTKNFI